MTKWSRVQNWTWSGSKRKNKKKAGVQRLAAFWWWNCSLVGDIRVDKKAWCTGFDVNEGSLGHEHFEWDRWIHQSL